MGLHAASEAAVPVRPKVWALTRAYLERYQMRDGGWGYTPQMPAPSGTMTSAGISSLVLSGARRFEEEESVGLGDRIQDCGEGRSNPRLLRAIDWMAQHFQVHENPHHGQS